MARVSLDWRKLVYHHNGREETITAGRSSRVVSELLA